MDKLLCPHLPLHSAERLLSDPPLGPLLLPHGAPTTTRSLVYLSSDLSLRPEGFVRQRETTYVLPYKTPSNMRPPFPQRTLGLLELFWQFTSLAASSSDRSRRRPVLASAPWFNVESVSGSLRPERTDSRALTPFYVIFEMEVSLHVRARELLRLDAPAVGAGVGGALAVAGPRTLNGSSTTHRLAFLKVTSDAVLPSVGPVS